VSLTNTLAPRAELLAGQQFAWSRRTPLQRSLIDGAERALTAALSHLDPNARVLREPDLLLTAQAAVIPDLAIFRGPTWTLPDLVVEYRVESTDRLFFGPKRLAYARARVPEVWFVDVTKRTVTVLQLTAALDYPWPPQRYGSGEMLVSKAIPSLEISALDLLGTESTVHGND
jgi:Uma2 family endonuclease